MRFVCSREFRRLWYVGLVALATFVGGVTTPAAADSESPFLPTWRLLNAEQKQQFIAGYLFGWNDAARITEIVASFVKENPDQAQQGLERLKSVYDLRELKPTAIAREVDRFYADPSNGNAGLSLAVTFARSKLQ